MAEKSQASQAEIRLGANGGALFGTVLQLDEQGATVRLNAGTASGRPVPPGAPVVVILATGTAVYASRACVTAHTTNQMTLVFSAPMQRLERRRDPRRPCNLAVSFRPLASESCRSVWQTVATRDVSTGGLGFVVDSLARIPELIQLIFRLPDAGTEANPGSAASPNNKRDDTNAPIKASAQVVFSRPQPDGSVLIGVNFKRIDPSDQLRLACFTGASDLLAADNAD